MAKIIDPLSDNNFDPPTGQKRLQQVQWNIQQDVQQLQAEIKELEEFIELRDLGLEVLQCDMANALGGAL